VVHEGAKNLSVISDINNIFHKIILFLSPVKLVLRHASILIIWVSGITAAILLELIYNAVAAS
jgi:hypothetical protein